MDNRNDKMLNKVTATGDVYKCKNDKEDFNPISEQLFFVMKDRFHEFALGLTDLLSCLYFAEEQGELPEHSKEWWIAVKERYGMLHEIL